MQFIDLKAQYNALQEKIDLRVRRVLDHGNYIMGPEVAEFEEALADYVGVKHVISCANGTDAIQLALMAVGVGPGDAVIVPSFSFFATAEAPAVLGAEVVFCDIKAETFNMCELSLLDAVQNYKKKGENNLKAIIAVDLFGQPANYDALSEICSDEGLILIEDGAQGFGGSIGRKRACSFGDISTTSFFPAKPLGCYGDGGAIFTDDSAVAELLKSLRVHGKGDNKYDNVRLGLNSRLDTIQAAILIEKLEAFGNELVARNEIATRYQAQLGDFLSVPIVPNNYGSSWAQFTVRAASAQARDDLRLKLRNFGVPTSIYYPTPLHLSKAFLEHSEGYTQLTNSTLASSTVFSIPMHPYLDKYEQSQVVEAITTVMT